MTAAALYIDPQGTYSRIPGLDLWPESRDARLYAGSSPVIAHPPCHLWVNLAAVNWKRYGKTRPAWYPGGDDGGCFASALAAVRRCGGVLEHPASSHAWRAHGLARPLRTGWLRVTATEWTCEVWQSAYGHPARKRTWLWYCSPRGQAPADACWERNPGTHQIGWFDRAKPTLGKRAASHTPPAFAEYLIDLAVRS